MNIVMVSNWPPSGRPVSEYGYHLVQGLANCEEVNKITVLADIFEEGSEPVVSDKVRVIRCWDYDSHLTLEKLIWEVKKFNPDVCWFNITLGSFGTSTANFPALITPLALRTMGFTTLITLHNLVELTKMDEIGGANRLRTLGAEVATWFLARTPVCVLLPEYEVVLRRKYKASRVFVVPHGTLGQPCEVVSVPDNNTLLCFGIFGTHKKLEMLLEAMTQLHQEAPDVRLRVVGGSNSHNPTYLENLKATYKLPNAEFVGYVSEADVPGEFIKAKAVVLPYITIGGESGTLIQAGMYGKPVLVSDLPLFRSKTEDYSLTFFENHPRSIKEAILELVNRPKDILLEQGLRNRNAATRNSMEEVCHIYLSVITRLQKR